VIGGTDVPAEDRTFRITVMRMLKEQRDALVIVQPLTVSFQRLYCFVVMSLDRRKILHVIITKNPTAEWVAQTPNLRLRLGIPPPVEGAGHLRASVRASPPPRGRAPHREHPPGVHGQHHPDGGGAPAEDREGVRRVLARRTVSSFGAKLRVDGGLPRIGGGPGAVGNRCAPRTPMTSAFHNDTKFCPCCNEYVNYLASNESSYCIQCGAQAQMSSEADRAAFQAKLAARGGQGWTPQQGRSPHRSHRRPRRRLIQSTAPGSAGYGL
jgi:hypothetical protein